MAKKTTKPMSMRFRIEGEIEQTGAYEAVVETLVAEAAKPVTTRLVAKIEAALRKHAGPGDFEVRLTRSYGMTNIEWGGYSKSQGNRGHSILLSHSTKSEPIAQRYLDDAKRYLVSKHERNARRAAMLATDAPERIDAAREKIRAAFAELNEIHDADDNFTILPSTSTLVEEIVG
jgi:hypothetical protein